MNTTPIFHLYRISNMVSYLMALLLLINFDGISTSYFQPPEMQVFLPLACNLRVGSLVSKRSESQAQEPLEVLVQAGVGRFHAVWKGK